MICKAEENFLLTNSDTSMNNLDMALLMNNFGMLFTQLVDITLKLSLSKNSVNIFKKELPTEKYDRLNHFILHTNYIIKPTYGTSIYYKHQT
jgi:hypothetical protein